jgi:hypothetical protein
MNTTPAPSQFTELGLQTDKFTQSDKKSWRGPCPACGGTRRYVVFTDHEFPLWNGMCDQCGRRDKFWQGRAHLDPAKIKSLHEQMEREQAQLARERQAKLDEFSVSEIWQNLHNRMNPSHRQWWTSQGVPDDWQEYYQLGYKEAHRAEHGGEYQVFQAYSIPKFDFGRKLVNIDYRLIGAPTEWGKYRPQQGIPQAAFISNPDLTDYPDEVYIVEGSKKAMVCNIYLTANDPLFFIGVPSCNSWAGITAKVKERRCWIMLDPGAEMWASKLAREIGKNARIIRLPDKPDDLAMSGALYAGNLEYLKKTARGVL